MSFIYKDYIPANARILVDYTAHEPVKFSYPLEWTYWEAVWKAARVTITQFWMLLHFRIMNYIMLFLFLPSVVIFAFFIPFSKAVPEGILNNLILQIYVVMVLTSFIYFYVLPAIFTICLALKKEWLSYLVPKVGRWAAILSGTTIERVFNKEDIRDNVAIIPAFSNVYLEYECEGDFEKYLEKVEIMELPCTFEIRSKLFPWRKKTKINDDIFRAIFKFSKVPENGSMKVIYN